jgi:hypothetical protein
MSVLVIDDDADLLAILDHLLQLNGDGGVKDLPQARQHSDCVILVRCPVDSC